MAPVAAFAAAFEGARVPVSVEEIRNPMGLEKRQHIVQMFHDERIAARWRSVYGSNPSELDAGHLYDAFNKRLFEVLPHYAEPIPGVLDAIARLRAAGIKIGSNSGYSSSMMAILSARARERGFQPDCIVSASDVSAARPAPDLSLKCLELLQLPADSVAVKVDDTRSGIEEGRNAGLWTVAVAVSGNEVGLSLEEWTALTPVEQLSLRNRAYENLCAVEPDYVIDTVADLGSVISGIEERVRAGERAPALR